MCDLFSKHIFCHKIRKNHWDLKLSKWRHIQITTYNLTVIASVNKFPKKNFLTNVLFHFTGHLLTHWNLNYLNDHLILRDIVTLFGVDFFVCLHMLQIICKRTLLLQFTGRTHSRFQFERLKEKWENEKIVKCSRCCTSWHTAVIYRSAFYCIWML